MVTVGKLAPADRAEWETLFRAYIDFYERTLPHEMYDRAWTEFQADSRMHAFGAWINGQLVGIVHFLVHPNTTRADVCYLEDLFTAPQVRGKGVGRALINAVADWARARGCSELYWQTQDSNATARQLYDKVATFEGFLVYTVTLDQ